MLDIKFVRDNAQAVQKAAIDKNIDLDVNALLEVDDKRRALTAEFESLLATKNKFSKEIGKFSDEEKQARLLEMKEVDQRAVGIKENLRVVTEQFEDFMYRVPNIPSPETPIGKDSSGNVPWVYWSPALGQVDSKDTDKVAQVPPHFEFDVKDHITLGKELDLIDVEAGTKTSGFRGYYLKNEAVLMQQGLIWHALKKMQSKGFTIMTPPTLVREFALYGSGHFPAGREEIYQVVEARNLPVPSPSGELLNPEAAKEQTYLAGTSEPSLLAYYADKTLDEKQLPIKLCGVSTCYRSEIGSYGKDTRGLYRVHEFTKVEQVVICKADILEGDKWLEALREIAQEMLMDLKLSHRVLNICTGDMGMGKYKMYDIETWMPSRQDFGETHSDSNLTDWQARRLNLKYKTADGKTKYAYTLNNTVIASPRILIAILENYQQRDGSVMVPDILKTYVGKDAIKKPQ